MVRLERCYILRAQAPGAPGKMTQSVSAGRVQEHYQLSPHLEPCRGYPGLSGLSPITANLPVARLDATRNGGWRRKMNLSKPLLLGLGALLVGRMLRGASSTGGVSATQGQGPGPGAASPHGGL